MDVRESENEVLERLRGAARGTGAPPQSARDANVFRLAARLLRPRFTEESARLEAASTIWFQSHPRDQAPVEDMIRHGWVRDPAWLRARLEDLLDGSRGR